MAAFISKLTPFAAETLTVSNVVKQLTASKYDATADIAPGGDNRVGNGGRKAKAAMVTIDSANPIRATEEGTTPVAATTGISYGTNDTKILESYQAIVQFKMIRDGAADSSVQVVYFR